MSVVPDGLIHSLEDVATHLRIDSIVFRWLSSKEPTKVFLDGKLGLRDTNAGGFR